MEDQRKFGRIPFGSRVILECENRMVHGSLHDLSLKGAKVALNDELAMEESESCLFVLELSAGIKLTFRARVIHCEGQTVGLKFTESDPESFAHLLRLMELNTGDSEQVERELNQLGF